jgi:hypothetical protein
MLYSRQSLRNRLLGSRTSSGPWTSRAAGLVATISRYIVHRNDVPTPFVWTKSAKEIIEKIDRGLRILEAVQ